MAVPLPPNSIIQINAEILAFGQTLINTTHWQTSLTTVPDYFAELTSAITFCRTNALGWINLLVPCLGTNIELNMVTAQPVYPQRLRPVRVFDGRLGTGGADCNAQNLAAVIHKISDIAARWGQGSMHVGGLPTTFYAGGLITTAGITQLTPLAGVLPRQFMGTLATYFPSLWNATTPTRATPFTHSDIATTVRVMRRRTVGVGI